MIYLLSEILLCLALAALLGGALGWLAQRARGTERSEEARQALVRQSRQLAQARTDVTMLSDDFDDLRERSRVEIETLREANRELPIVARNLEKSQALVQQMMQRHEAQVRELSTANVSLERRLAAMQQEHDAERQERDRAADAGAPSATTRASTGNGTDDVAAPIATALASDGGGTLDEAAANGPRASAADAAVDDAALAIPAPAGPDEATGDTASDTASSRRGWASLPLVERSAPDVADESMDEVIEVDDDLAAELDDLAGGPRGGTAGATGAGERRPAAWGPTGGADGEVDGGAANDAAEADDAETDEDADATLAIDVFSMDDVHDVEAGYAVEAINARDDGSLETGERVPPMFGPVDRQDDLQRIVGIGPITEKALNELGITSYPQLAELERPEIETIARALQIVPERIERDDWVGNARRQLEDVLEEL